MLRIFIGYDERQPVSYNVLQQSILSHSSKPVAITPLVLSQLPLKRQGLTPFTFSRFLVPYLCNYEGFALFLDADMLLTADISELFEYVEEKYKFSHLFDNVSNVTVIAKPTDKAAYVSKNQHKFEWASAIMFNCSHPSNKILTPEYIETAKGLHGIEWLKDEEIGDLPPEWNRLVGYDEFLDDAKLLHYTQGVPVFEETKDSPRAEEWLDVKNYMNSAITWKGLMGSSVHAVNCNGKLLPKFLFDLEKGQVKEQYEETVKKLLS